MPAAHHDALRSTNCVQLTAVFNIQVVTQWLDDQHTIVEAVSRGAHTLRIGGAFVGRKQLCQQYTLRKFVRRLTGSFCPVSTITVDGH